MNFNTKAEYLEAIAQWKADYLELSAKIRKARTAYKEAQRAGESVYRTLNAYESLKSDATEAISERHESKEEAQRQYIRDRESKLAA